MSKNMSVKNEVLQDLEKKKKDLEEKLKPLRELEEDYRIIDMRRPKVGDGFSWGLSGPETLLRRYGYQTMFAYQYIERDNRPWWQKLFGRK